MLTLSELGSLLKGNRRFWFKRIVTAVVPGSAYLLFSAPSFSVRLGAGIVFLFAAPASASWFLVGSIVEPVIFSIRFRKSTPVEDEDLDWVLKASGVRLKNRVLKLVKGLDNAFTSPLTKTISFGDELYNRQSREDKQVVLGHEVGHLVAPFLSLRTIGLLGAAALMMLIVSPVIHDVYTSDIIMMSIMYLVTVPMRWNAEYAADEHACKLFGPGRVIAALERLVPADRRSLDGDSHPSIERRIRRIKQRWKIE